MHKQILIILAFLVSPVVSQASLIDFTDASWQTAIDAGDGYSATIGNVTIASTGGKLTFNAGDNGGCVAGQPGNGLACAGDGIGIRDDEITQGGYEKLTVSFLEPVDVTDIILLDLFGTERSGEIAVIDGGTYHALPGSNEFPGGYFATGFSGTGIMSLVLTGYKDCFSDYALAAIEVSPVPIPGAVFLFSSALLGFMGFKRFS